MDPTQKKKPRYDDVTVNNNGQIRCDSCSISISYANDYVQNTPCNHNICVLCIVKSNMTRVANPAYCQVKDCPQRPVSCQYFNRGSPGEIVVNETTVELSSDGKASVFSFLDLEEIMHLRCVCKSWREAVKKTNVPLLKNFCVDSSQKYNAISVMRTELPTLHRITIDGLGDGQKWSDGEDPIDLYTLIGPTPYDFGIISAFSKLRELKITGNSFVSGRHPFLFSSFPLLEILSIDLCHGLKWDLEMLAGFPILKELECTSGFCLTGNINSLRVLRETLRKVKIHDSEDVKGNFMDLADFPRLKELDLDGDTAVTGDIRDIGENNFLTLTKLTLPRTVYGGRGYEFQRISDAPELIRTLYLFKKQRPGLAMLVKWYARLSDDSPDRYPDGHQLGPGGGSHRYDSVVKYDAPFDVCFVKAGSRIGYRWESDGGIPCEINWLDPEPRGGNYLKRLQEIEKHVETYKGFHQPPTEEEYNRLLENGAMPSRYTRGWLAFLRSQGVFSGGALRSTPRR